MSDLKQRVDTVLAKFRDIEELAPAPIFTKPQQELYDLLLLQSQRIKELTETLENAKSALKHRNINVDFIDKALGIERNYDTIDYIP